MPAQTSETLEERIAAVEKEVKQLKQAKSAQRPEEPRGWQRMVGIFADNPSFEEAVRYGREWRESEDLMDDEATS